MEIDMLKNTNYICSIKTWLNIQSIEYIATCTFDRVRSPDVEGLFELSLFELLITSELPDFLFCRKDSSLFTASSWFSSLWFSSWDLNKAFLHIVKSSFVNALVALRFSSLACILLTVALKNKKCYEKSTMFTSNYYNEIWLSNRWINDNVTYFKFLFNSSI